MVSHLLLKQRCELPIMEIGSGVYQRLQISILSCISKPEYESVAPEKHLSKKLKFKIAFRVLNLYC